MRDYLRLLGAATLLAFSYDPIYYAYKWNYKEPIDLKKNYGNGSYALITGATEGIGKAFSRAIAAQGLNVILVGRNPEKLRSVQSEIEKEFNVKVVAITADLDEIHENVAKYAEIQNQLQQYDISILVNNVGQLVRKKIDAMTPEEINRLNGVNCYPMAHFTNIILNQFAHRRTRSAVINVSSILGRYPLCGATVYNATKCYDYGFSMALGHEYNDIADVLTLCPGRTKTNMNKNEKVDFFCPLPDKVAEGALRDLGTRKLSYGAPGHDLMGWSLNFVPESFRIALSGFLLKKGLFNP